MNNELNADEIHLFDDAPAAATVDERTIQTVDAVATNENRGHALLAPSAAKRWMNCPASVYDSKDVPNTASEHAAYGTKGHAWSEVLAKHLLINNDKFSYSTQLAEYRKEDAELAMYCENYVQFVQTMIDEMLRVRNPKKIDVYIELKVDVYSHTYGTADTVLVVKNQDDSYNLVVCDLKLGKGVKVDPEDADQLKIYLQGVYKKFVVPANALINAAHLFIYQPRINPEDPWKKHKVSRDELLNDTIKYYEGHNRALKVYQEGPTPEDYSVGDHCRFCPALPTCATHKNYRSNEVGFLLEDANEPDIIPPDVQLIPTDQLLRIFKAKKPIETFLKQVERYLLVQMSTGKKIPGYKLVYSRGKSSWKKGVEDYVEKLLEAKGCEAPTVKKLIGITKAKSFLGKDEVALYTQKSAQKLQVADSSDPREEVSFIDPASLLEDEGEDENND